MTLNYLKCLNLTISNVIYFHYVAAHTRVYPEVTLTFYITRCEATQMVMASKLTRLTHRITIPAPNGRGLYHFKFSLQAASPETFGYTLVY